MFKRLSEEYHQLCLREIEAEERAFSATTAIRARWHIDAGTAKGAPSHDALGVEADLWERVAELRNRRHAWVAEHSLEFAAAGAPATVGRPDGQEPHAHKYKLEAHA